MRTVMPSYGIIGDMFQNPCGHLKPRIVLNLKSTMSFSYTHILMIEFNLLIRQGGY